MEYFELCQSKAVENPLVILKLDKEKYNYTMTEENFAALEKLKVAWFSGREFEEVCDILTEPAFLISDRLKQILQIYDKEISFKGVQLFSTAEESKLYPLYWVPGFVTLDCLHEKTKKLDNGMLKSLVLEERKIGKKPIFRIGGLLEYKVAVSLPVAESILRRRPYGVSLQRIEVE